MPLDVVKLEYIYFQYFIPQGTCTVFFKDILLALFFIIASIY